MSKPVKLVLVAVVLVAVAGGTFLWWFFRDDAPDEVDLGAAVDAVEEQESGDGTTPDSAAEAASALQGTWTVDGDSGTFDFSDTASGTFVGFRVDEELTGVGASTAVGRTPEVDGQISIDGTELAEAVFEADMTAITTNESRRDTRVQQALDTSQFPAASFVLTEPVDLAGAASGGPVSVTATGELTIKGVTQTVEIPLEAQLTGETIVVVGSMDIVFADYGVQVPSAPVVVSAEDEGVLEVQLLLTRG